MPEDYHRSRSCQLSARINTRFASIVWHGYSGIPDLQPGSSSKAYNDGKVNWENSGKIVNCCWWQQQCAVVDWWFSPGNADDIFKLGRGQMLALSAYLGLFAVAFGAATLLPFQSEPLLVGLLLSGEFSTLGLVAVASFGNVLGAVCN